MHWGLPPDSCVAQGCVSRYVSDLPILYFVRPPTQYPPCCFFSLAADASSRVPLPPHPSLTYTLTSNHIAAKGFLRNLDQLSSLVSLNHLGLPLLAEESLNHCSLSTKAPHPHTQ